MRKIVVVEFITLDGVMQAPGGPEEDTSGDFKFGGWTAPFFDDEAGKMMGSQMEEPYALLLGQKTYEIFSSYWPEHESEWPGINSSKKYVVSETLSESNWENCEFIKGDVVEKIKELKEEDGPDLKVWGSGNLVQTLLKNDLVDELWLKIFPVTLGEGKKLFAQGTIPTTWELTDFKVTQKGIIFANYKKTGEVKTGSVG